MAEVFVVANAAPKQCKEFEKWVNTRKYPFEGFRKGFNKPFISETKLYSVKVKKECLPMFLADLKASTQEISSLPCGNIMGVANKGQAILNFLIRCVNIYYRIRHVFVKKRRSKTSLIRHPPKSELEKDKIGTVDMKKIPRGEDSLEGWINTKVLFVNRDIVNNQGEEEL